MSFIYGAIGAMVILASAVSGFAAGVYVEKRLASLRKPEAEELSETVRAKLRQEQEAFDAIQSYSADTAYGLGGELRARHESKG